MLRTQFFRSILFVIVLIAVIHFIGLQYYFYWSITGYDKVNHFLGGFWIALVAVWLCFFSGFAPVSRNTYARFLSIALFGALIVGVAWEIFEFTFGLTYLSYNFWSDTIGDITADLGGAIVASVYMFIGQKKANE